MQLLGLLFFLFTVVPLAELVLLLRLGTAIGAVPTVGLVVLTGIVGAGLARWQGVQALSRLRADLQAGRPPAGAIWDGAAILVAGTLLITPGVMTDAVGFTLLIPPLRAALGRFLAARFAAGLEAGIQNGSVQVVHFGGGRPADAPRGFRGATAEAEVIDVEATVVESGSEEEGLARPGPDPATCQIRKPD